MIVQLVAGRISRKVAILVHAKYKQMTSMILKLNLNYIITHDRPTFYSAMHV